MPAIDFVKKVFRNLFGDKQAREMRRVLPIIDEINEWYEDYQALSDDDLRGKTAEFRQRLAEGETLNDILPEAFAVAKEACRRFKGRSWEAAGVPITWDMVPYDVQLAGGIFLHEGKIAEMGTGEGKTLVAVCPVYLNALEGKGVHVVTVNDYLARRDSQWMGPVFEFLGLTVGCLDDTESGSPERKAAYECDITYGTNHEFGFDYLRDNYAMHSEQLVQLRGHNYAIVDEVDNILIDEARTPLIISGPVNRPSAHRYEEFKPMVEKLVKRQLELLNQLVTEAEALLKRNPQSREAGLKLLMVQRGNPKHKRLTKLKGEPGIGTLIEKIELEHIADKKMHEIDEQVYYVVDERGHQIDLTDKGRVEVTPDNPKLWEMPDIVEEIAAVDAGQFDVIELTDGRKVLHRGTAAERAAERNADGSYTIHTHDGVFSIAAGDIARVYAGTDVDKRERDLIVKEVVRADHGQQSLKLHNISQLLRAYTLYERDHEYVVIENKVVIVDEFTGRLMHGRQWQDGLHQAVECKEGVEIAQETQTLASITLQNFFRMYTKLAGMTGTAETEAGEFAHTYKMDVTVVPPNRPTQRVDHADVVYKTRRAKYNAVLEEVVRCHEAGLPVLVGTVSVDASETLSRMLRQRKIEHSVLNAKQHQKEAEIVAGAGREGAVTIATNMAGRGTDIKLGQGVAEKGGLQIIGTERHESRRIDRQLRGRAGRQGDPGSSKFYLSLEDDLMRMFGGERISKFMDMLGIQEDEPIESSIVTRSIESAQKKVEARNFDIRKRTLEYDNVMNRQREAIYGLRRQILLGEDLRSVVMDLAFEAIGQAVPEFCQVDDPTITPAEWHVESLLEFVFQRVPYAPEIRDIPRAEIEGRSADEITDLLMGHVETAYQRKLEELGDEVMTSLARYVALKLIDTEWMDHLHAIDELREGIHWRGYAQLDPLVEYQKEASVLFEGLMQTIQRGFFDNFFLMQPVMQEAEPVVNVTETEARQATLEETLPPPPPPPPPVEMLSEEAQEDAGMIEELLREEPEHMRAPQPQQQTIVRSGPKVKPNDPCPCGSGKKYKKCHGAKAGGKGE